GCLGVMCARTYARSTGFQPTPIGPNSNPRRGPGPESTLLRSCPLIRTRSSGAGSKAPLSHARNGGAFFEIAPWVQVISDVALRCRLSLKGSSTIPNRSYDSMQSGRLRAWTGKSRTSPLIALPGMIRIQPSGKKREQLLKWKDFSELRLNMQHPDRGLR